MKDYPKAIAVYERGIKLDPDFIPCRFRRGVLSEMIGKNEQAMSDYDKCIELQPKRIEAYIMKIDLLLKTNRVADALKQADFLVSMKPKESFPYCMRGEARFRSNMIDQAISDFDHSIALDTNDSDSCKGEAYFYRGLAHEKKGDKAKAASDIARAQQLGFEQVKVRWLLI